MKNMTDNNNYNQLCYTLAKALNTAVRLYRKQNCLYYYSVYHLHPDPANPYLPDILDSAQGAGIFVTPLYQFYAYITLDGSQRLIIGPSRIRNKDVHLQEELLFLLGVSTQKRDEYLRILHCVPDITAERLGWLLSFLSMAVNRCTLKPEELSFNLPASEYDSIIQQHINQTVDTHEDIRQNQHRMEYNAERLLLSYIENGEPEKISELFSSAPTLSGGPMADNTLRQIKNTCICTASLAARAAISGGMDDDASFRLSDLYIQRVELTQDIPSLEKLRTAIMTGFAEQVKQVRYHTAFPSDSRDKSLFNACASYVSQNLYRQIRVEEMAQELGYARAYLCSRFKRQTGLTLTQYILQQKIVNAQRMLTFTDKSISEIAALYEFSSQSHFQNVFKRIVGETPQIFRQRTQKKGRRNFKSDFAR